MVNMLWGKKSHLNTVKDGIRHFKIVVGYKIQ